MGVVNAAAGYFLFFSPNKVENQVRPPQQRVLSLNPPNPSLSPTQESSLTNTQEWILSKFPVRTPVPSSKKE